MVVSKMDDGELNIWDEDAEDFPDHIELKERLRKTLYYGKSPRMDCPSLPMTELAVEYFHDAVPRELGRVDMYWASSVSRKASISPCAMMLGMLYIDRLRNKDPDYLAKISSEDLFLVVMMLASKYLYDEGVTEEVYNDEWADSANLDTEDINQLERDFLSAIDWNLFVSGEEFEQILDEVETQIALRQGKLHNGSLTYSDMVVLLHCRQMTQHNWHLLKEICKVFAVCSLAYTAGGLTMVASTTTVDLLKAELVTPRPLTFDLTPLTLLMQQFAQWLGPVSLLPRTSISSSQLPQPSIGKSQLPQTSISDENLPVLRIGDVGLAESIQDSELNVDGTDNSDSGCERKCRQKKKKSSFLSQFLTLTLFKDTLITFVVGMKQDSDGNETESSTKSTCHCPVCPLNAKNSRRNKTYHQGARPASPRLFDTKIPTVMKPRLTAPHYPDRKISGDVLKGGTEGGGNGNDVLEDGGNRNKLPWYCRANQCQHLWRDVITGCSLRPGASNTLLI